MPSARGPRYFWSVHREFSRGLRQPPPAAAVHASDLYALPAARAAAKRMEAILTYDARELYPHVASTAGRRWVSWFWKTVESRCIVDCDAVFTVNASIADRLTESYGITRPIVVENVPPTQAVDKTHRIRDELHLDPDIKVVLHQGQMREGRGCELLVRAAPRVPDAHFVFLGSGPLRSELSSIAESLQIADRIHFLDAVPPNELLSYTASATLGVTLLEDTCLNHRLALPNKLFEYLMAGVPVLASDLPEIRGVVEPNDVGCLVAPGDLEAIANTLRYMLEDSDRLGAWASNTRRVFETINWESASERFVSEFQRLLSSRN